jgi:hypothetical protein
MGDDHHAVSAGAEAPDGQQHLVLAAPPRARGVDLE